MHGVLDHVLRVVSLLVLVVKASVLKELVNLVTMVLVRVQMNALHMVMLDVVIIKKQVVTYPLDLKHVFQLK
jgi:hypothetical protein